MYDELYEAWKREVENAELGTLPSDFYLRIAEYLKKLKEEGRMLDKRTVRASLLKSEMQNVKRMTRELILTRYKKLVKKTAAGEKIPSDILTIEEDKVCKGISPFAEVFHSFAENIFHGHAKLDVEQHRKRVVLRFVKEVPAVMGGDMKTYGPFKIEDVASVPVENAKILIKQGLAEKVEVHSL